MKVLPLLGVFLMLLSSCRKVEDPEFRRLENFRVKSFGVQIVDLGLGITYYNPNNFGVTVKEAVTDIYIDSVYIGKFNQDADVIVRKNAEFSIPLSGRLPIGTALKLRLETIALREISIMAKGSVKIGKAGIFIERPFSYAGKHKINFKI